ncbi:MAG: peptidase M23, partial [Alphaproteobacteria bacterium]|nr:peptidase M23 [Alphaproteobacteria bacterium]
VLQTMQTSPETLSLLHPSGPVATARAGMIVADVTPAIEDRVRTLKAALDEITDLRRVQDSAIETLQDGLDGAQAARTALSKAISDRLPPPDASATE